MYFTLDYVSAYLHFNGCRTCKMYFQTKNFKEDMREEDMTKIELFKNKKINANCILKICIGIIN